MDTNYGGICVFIRSCFRVSIVHLPEYKTAELLVVSINSGEFKAVLFVIYRPGSAAITSLFFEELADAFERCSGYDNLIVVGDVNVHLDCPALSTTKQFVSLLGVYDLLECVQQPTHNRGHQLDVYITRSDQLQPVIRVDPPIISDHSLITATYNIELNIVNNRPRVPRRRWRTFNVDDFTSDLIASDLICNPPDDVSELFTCYDETLTQLLDKHAPVVYVTQYARPSSPWFNTECHLAKVKTRKLEKLYRKHRTAATESAWRTQFNNQRILFQSKFNNYWKVTIRSCAKNNKALWSKLRCTCSRPTDR